MAATTSSPSSVAPGAPGLRVAAPDSRGSKRLRVLVVTKLFPSGASPTFAVYNGLQMAALARVCDVDVRATVPWFPGARILKRWSPAGQFAELPARETVHGLDVRHPRFLALPRVGRIAAPALYAASLWPGLRGLAGKVDVVLGCWAFPDGLAAILLARHLGAAVAVKVHGSDLNVLPQDATLRRLLEEGLPKVDRLIAVSRPLGQRAIELGVPADRVEVVSNGIDREIFKPADRTEARRALGLPLDGPLIAYVGRLDRAKGLHELLDAFRTLAQRHPALRLAIVGDGPELGKCQQAAAEAWVGGRLFLPGALPMPQVAAWIAACDVLTLPSWNEGTPNVLMEAFACGRRVVATSVGGIPDVVSSPELGELVPVRDVPALTAALERVAFTPYVAETLTRAAPYGWPESGARLRDVLQAAVDHHRAQTTGAVHPAGAARVRSP